MGFLDRAQNCQLSEEMLETLRDIEIEPRFSVVGFNTKIIGIYGLYPTRHEDGK